MWAKRRLAEGWDAWSLSRMTRQGTSVPRALRQLPESEKEYDRRAAIGAPAGDFSSGLHNREGQPIKGRPERSRLHGKRHQEILDELGSICSPSSRSRSGKSPLTWTTPSRRACFRRSPRFIRRCSGSMRKFRERGTMPTQKPGKASLAIVTWRELPLARHGCGGSCDHTASAQVDIVELVEWAAALEAVCVGSASSRWW